MFVMKSDRSGAMMQAMISMMTSMTMSLKVVDVMREDPSVDMASVLQLLEERQGKLARFGRLLGLKMIFQILRILYFYIVSFYTWT